MLSLLPGVSRWEAVGWVGFEIMSEKLMYVKGHFHIIPTNIPSFITYKSYMFDNIS